MVGRHRRRKRGRRKGSGEGKTEEEEKRKQQRRKMTPVKSRQHSPQISTFLFPKSTFPFLFVESVWCASRCLWE